MGNEALQFEPTNEQESANELKKKELSLDDERAFEPGSGILKEEESGKPNIATPEFTDRVKESLKDSKLDLAPKEGEEANDTEHFYDH